MHTGGSGGQWYPTGTSPLPEPATPEPATPGHLAGGRRRRPSRRALIVPGVLAAVVIVGIGSILSGAQGVTVAGTPLAASAVNPGRVSTTQPAPPTTGTTPAPPATSTAQPAPPTTGTTRPGSGTTQPVPPSPGDSTGQSPRGGSPGRTGVPGPGSGAGAGPARPGSATAAQQVGVVDIDTVLGFDAAAAAGTGLVLTPAGVVLTNNHVVEGSTRITVTVTATGQTYPATVVGTDATDDIAVLQLTGASGLGTANLAGAAPIKVGDPVTGVGNAGGAGGTPSAATGTVTATDLTITTQSDGSAAGETLHGLIQTSAAIQSGDSGGPLFNAADQVVGIDTAAEQGRRATIAGYAIPIAAALAIADQIRSGPPSPNITIGYPAFLGVQVSARATTRYRSPQPATVAGAPVSAVIPDTPAANAGLKAGDTITAIDGTTIASAAALDAALAGHTPGQDVTITWVDPTGATQSTSLILATGPAA